MSALLELCPDQDAFINRLNGLGLPGVKVKKETAVKCGITGTHVDVAVNGIHEGEHMHSHGHHSHEHHHTGMHEIEHIISGLELSDKIKKDILAVYGIIAEAESRAHGRPVDLIHFHEVGTMDAVADIAGVCMLMDEIKPEKVVVSPVHVGSGTVKCAHGILPVPAPATAYILREVPIYGGEVRGELCTPTGAALLKYFADEFGDMPVMKIKKIGYGMGTKDFESANCVRVMLGETEKKAPEVLELCCNIDDMTAEGIAFAAEKIMDAGALDVFTAAVGMKKNRPGILLVCVCGADRKDDVLKAVFRYTSTIGVREREYKRYTLERREENVLTPFGSVRVKYSEGYGVKRAKAEYDDLAKIAAERNISISEAGRLVDGCIEQAYAARRDD